MHACLMKMPVGFARWRDWAAKLRDGGGPLAADAGLLCKVLDVFEENASRSPALVALIKPTLETLVGRLLLAGAPPMAVPARL